MNIQTEKRNNDWIAFVSNRPGIWEAGKNEAEAIGKLVICLRESWRDELIVEISSVLFPQLSSK